MSAPLMLHRQMRSRWPGDESEPSAWSLTRNLNPCWDRGIPANCPSGVPTEQILQQVRTSLLEKKGFSLFYSLVYRGVLSSRDRLEKVMRLVRLLDRTPLRNQVAGNAAAKALPMVRQMVTCLPASSDVPEDPGQKIDDIEQTGADIVATSCPSCYLQISAGLWRRGLNVRVTHPVVPAQLYG